MTHPLSIDDVGNQRFQTLEWRIERVAWSALVLLLVAAVLGAFGVGPLSSASLEAADGSVRVEYQRFVRNVGNTSATFVIDESTIADGKATLYISSDLASGWSISKVSPTPSSEKRNDEWLVFEFDAASGKPTVAHLQYRGDGFGRRAGAVRAGESGTPVYVRQWLYP